MKSASKNLYTCIYPRWAARAIDCQSLSPCVNERPQLKMSQSLRCKSHSHPGSIFKRAFSRLCLWLVLYLPVCGVLVVRGSALKSQSQSSS